MQDSKTTIHVAMPIVESLRNKPLGKFLQWWVESKSDPEKRISEIEQSRRNLLKIIKELQEQNITAPTEKLFTDLKLIPPYNFTQVTLSRGAVHTGELEEFIISGIGNAQSLIEWLKQNKYAIEVRQFNI